MSKVRGFEVALTTKKMVDEGKAKEEGVEQFKGLTLPKRETARAAGYDFRAAEDTVIPSIWNGVVEVLMAKPIEVVNWVQEAIKGTKDIDKQQKLRDDNKKYFMPIKIHTGIKAYMQEDEVLELYVRSSTPKKFGLILANSVGIIDADYYNNIDNDGEIIFMVYNILPFDVTIKKGERFGQGIFKKFYIADNDIAGGKRKGGLGSSDEK